MTLSPGDRLGPYQLTSLAGEGGMGTVWKARDPRLDRTVALKVSKAAFTERFEREARAVAALNHPHICQLYDIGPNYLVMEFVDGVPLKGPLPVEKAVEYAGQILDALDAAHKKGITHRDLKPANILVTKQGIKLLDFGLAKQTAPVGPLDATQTAITEKGQIVGTLLYMSPEQLQGKEVDARSDLFSFGCVLYEMLSGKRPFTGDSAASIIAAIMEREPVRLELGPPLERVLRTCLAKDPEQRFQTAIDLKRDLLWAVDERPQTAVASSRVPAWAMGLLLLLAGGLAWSLWRTPARTAGPPSAITRLTRDGRSTSPALSPDGKLLAYSSSRAGNNFDIYVQQSGSSSIRLTDDPAFDGDPAFSADGSKIYFSSSRSPRGIYEVPALGGDARLVIPDATRPKPSPKGTHISYLHGGQVYVDTIPPRKAVSIGTDPVFSHAVWSPDGTRLIVRSPQDFEIVSVTGEHREALPLMANLTKRGLSQGPQYAAVRWLPGDDLLFINQHGDAFNLWRISLRDAAGGVPSIITAGTSTERMRADAVANRVVYASASGESTLWSLPCDLNTGTVRGPLKKLLPGELDGFHADVTPDGSQLVYCSRRNGPQGIWSMDLRTGKDRLLAQMNLLGEDYSHTAISPDGKQVAAMAQDAVKHYGLALLAATGGPVKVIPSRMARLRGFTPDGRSLLLWERDNPVHVALLDTVTGIRSRILTRGKETFLAPRLSLDGRWLAFIRDDRKLYVAPFYGSRPIPDREWIEVAVGANQPAWSPDGKSLYYRVSRTGGNTDTTLMRQPLDAAKRPVGTATVFYHFEGITFGGPVVNPIAVARDQIILNMNQPSSDLWSIDLPPR